MGSVFSASWGKSRETFYHLKNAVPVQERQVQRYAMSPTEIRKAHERKKKPQSGKYVLNFGTAVNAAFHSVVPALFAGDGTHKPRDLLTAHVLTAVRVLAQGQR